jgi:polyhydroxyalkanoate synthesis regulator phasin
MKKKLSIDDLAQMVQRGFASVATKGDIQAVRDEIKETREVLAQAIDDLTTKLVAYAASTREDYVRLQGRLHELEERVSELEGSRRQRRAA